MIVERVSVVPALGLGAGWFEALRSGRHSQPDPTEINRVSVGDNSAALDRVSAQVQRGG